MGWFILIALLKLHIATEKTLLCAGIYAAVGSALALAGGVGVLGLLIGAGISFGVAYGYFHTLSRIDSGGLWWTAAIGLPSAAAAAQAFLLSGAA